MTRRHCRPRCCSRAGPPRHSLESEPVIDHWRTGPMPGSHADEKIPATCSPFSRGRCAKPVSVESLRRRHRAPAAARSLMRSRAKHDPAALAARRVPRLRDDPMRRSIASRTSAPNPASSRRRLAARSAGRARSRRFPNLCLQVRSDRVASDSLCGRRRPHRARASTMAPGMASPVISMSSEADVVGSAVQRPRPMA